MKAPSNTITVTLRRRASGYRASAFIAESLDWAHALASAVLASPAFGDYFAVATDWTGREMFTIGLAVPMQAAPQVQQAAAWSPAQPYHQPQLPAYQAPQQGAYGPAQPQAPYPYPQPANPYAGQQGAARALPAYQPPGVPDAEFDEED